MPSLSASLLFFVNSFLITSRKQGLDGYADDTYETHDFTLVVYQATGREGIAVEFSSEAGSLGASDNSFFS